jgi:DNA-binding CsgD family transcriptional regulator
VVRRATSTGSAVLVTGEAGVGKSALLRAAAGAAQADHGARVLSAAGSEFEAELTFAGLHQLLAPAADDLDGLLDVHREALAVALGLQGGATPPRLVLVSALLAWLRSRSHVAPLVAVVDDLHWVDRATVAVLGAVARRLDGCRVALLLAQRSEHDTFVDRTAIPELRLAPLSEPDAAALLRARHPALHPTVRRRVLGEAGGNSLALIELPTALTPTQQAARDVLPDTLPLSDRLKDVFTARLSTLPPHTLRLLLLAALTRGDGSELVATVAGSPGDLAAAEATGMVTVDRRVPRLVFAHPLVRAAVVEMAAPSDRRDAHRRLAELTTGDVRALHLADALVTGDDGVAADLEAVATGALERGDAVRAVAMLVRAAELSSTGGERARRLATAAYVGANVSGMLEGSRELLTLARRADPGVSTTLRASTAAAAQLLNVEGDIDTAHRLLVGALDAASVDDAPADVAEDALLTLLQICNFGGRDALWSGFDRVAARFAPVLSPEGRLAPTTLGDPVRSTAAQLGELDALVDEVDRELHPLRAVTVATIGHYVDRVPHRALEAVVDDHERGTTTLATQALTILATHAYLEGRWDDVDTLVDRGSALCEEHGYRMFLWGLLWPRMLVAAARGDERYLAGVRTRMHQWAIPRRAMAVRTFTADVEGLAALTSERFQDAYDHFASMSPYGWFPPHTQVAHWALLDVVEAAVRSGHHDDARRHVDAAVASGLDAISPRQRFLCRAAEALVADDDRYVDAAARALDEPGAAAAPFHLARVQLAVGERLRRDRAMRRARPHLEAAADRFEALRAGPWAARATAALRATGRVRAVPSAGATSALTAQEREVAELAASGLTNREIGDRLHLSPRTVGAHLYRVFPKLGVTSRAGLRDALNRYGA